ncbi:MAG TPA: hypothetical protein VHU87_04225, partial [Rhizomicrobium sp.]|nr:hypothetical protein [Rhizomicrobium sp.]
MVEIVTGAGTGLERSSGWVLGSRGQLGDASFNRYGENVYVNAANGNLVINRTDEVLIGLGQDDVLERTYNSEGDASDDNADNWMFNAQRHLKTVSGTANTTGSTITLVDWDGSNITYTYNATSGVYTYQPPTGALDTLSFDGAHTWTLTNGSTLVKDVYDSSNSGRIVSSTDRDNNKLSYAYNASGQLSTVTTPDGESTTLTWSGNDITSIVTTVTGGTTLTRVYYGYDSYNRLSTVTTDLSPNDNSLGSDAVTTTYGYASGGSKLVTSISQTGGANLAISYDSSGRVSSLVQTMATGVTNTTGFDYSTAGQVSITNNAGQISVLHFDSSGDLTQMTLPPAQPGFTAQTTSFTYNSSGAALTATDGLGNVTDYTYDANGNLTRVQNQTTGETVDRTYGSHNELLTETTYAVAADIVHGTGPSQPSTTRYAYNANIDVSYIVSAMGEVTHYVYDTALHGEVTQAYVYRGATYSVSTLGVSTAIATSALDSWLATSVDLTQAQRTDTLYDARGVADRVTTYSATTSAGAGDTTQPWSRVSYTTDQAGNLLTRQTVGETNIETFVYDGLNRITSSIDINGATTSIAYSDGTNTSTITLANGLTEASVYNLAGQLVSYTKSSTIPATTSEQTKYSYDAMGNLIMVTDAVGNDTYFLYDTLGRKIARISADGELTEYVYDADNRVITTIQYATKVATSALLSGTTPLDPTLASIRPASLSTDLWSWNIYDATGNLLETVDPRGNATVYTYDAMNRLISSKSYYLRVATTVTNTWRTTPQTTVRSPTANALDDLTRYFYDADGRQVGVLDGDGYLTQTTYNEAGQKTATIAYATAAASSLRVSADMPTLLTSVGSVAADIHTQYFYDNRGFLVYTLDDNLRPTYYVYDQAGHVIQTIDYAGSITSASGYPYSYVQAQVAALSTTGARMDYSIYNSASGQLAYTIDAVGDVVGYGYDGMGNVDKITQYAALHAGLTSSPSYSSMGSWVTSHAGSSDRITRKVYDQYDRLAYTIDALGHITEDRYDADDRVVLTIRYPGSYTVSDTDNEATLYTMTGSGTIPSGAVTTGQSYDSDGRVSDSFDAMGVHTANTYDVFDRVTDRVMGTGTAAVKTHYTYDAAGRVLTQTLAYTATEAAVTTYTYDGMGRVLTVTDPAGHVTTYTYDQIGQKLTATVPIDGTHSAVTTDAYDGFGNVASVINAAGNTSTYTYDWMGNVLTATVPLDPTHYAVTTDAYDSFGDLVSSTDALGNATTYTYDALGRVLTQTAPLDSAHNAVTTDAYDAFGDLTAVTDARGDTTTYAYDLLGRVVTATVPLTATTNAVTTDVYNVFGDLIQKTDPAGHVTLYYYDALDRLILEVNGVGDVTGYTYAATGGIATVTQYATLVTGAVAGTLPAVTANAALDETTTFTRDKLDRVTSITDADGYVQSFTLDAMGNRLTATNNFTGAPATTTNTYDYAGHLLTETLPITARNAAGALVPVVNVYTYDVSGNLITKVEASGLVDTRTTSYTYDEANRLTGTSGDAVKVVGNNLVTPTGTTTPTTSIQYDANGNIIEQTDANGAHTFFYYDMDNRKIAEVAQNDVAGTQATLTNWVYDKNGNVTSMTVYGDFITPPASAGGAPPSPVSSTNARTTLYAYDYDNRLTTTTVSALRSGTLGATYATSIADVTTSTVYDKDGNVLQQVDGLGNTTWTYYDNAGHRIGQVDQDGYLTTWAVDAFGNVTTEKRYATAVSTPTSTTTLATIVGGAPSSATNDRVTTFVYDQMGRRKSETRTGVISYTLNSANAPVLGATSSTINYTYNGLGEVLTKEEATGDTTTYAYDLAGRETLVTGATITDYTGASVAGVVSQSYDGLNNLIQSAAGVAGSLTRVTTYTYGAGGRLATMSDATAIPFTRTYEYDANGNTVKVSYTRTESNGSTVTEADATQYDAQGRAILQSVATQTGSTWTLGDTSQVQYDAYGEVSARGVNGIWQEQLSYDAGGRLVRSTAGDGSVRLFAYDAAGHQTLEIDSSGGALPAGYSWSTLTLEQAITLLTTGGTVGTVAVAGMVVTMTAYDKRGQAVETRQPLRQLGGSGTSTIDTTKTYNAFGEVLTQTDARGSGYTTSFVYNTLGKIIEQIDPSVSYTSESGVVASAAPTTHNYYDISGRLIGVEDANGNTNTRSLLAGTGYDGQDVLVLQEFHADGGIFTNKYDAFDDLRQTVNEVGNTENYIYDGMDRLIEDDHQSRPAGSPGNPTTSAVQLIDYYAYDGLGQRIQHWNNQLGTSVKETTDYDAQGRVVSMVDLGGNATTYSYSWNGATATSGLGTFGAWTKTTVNDAGLTAIDTTDYFGREVAKTDFGGHVYAYTYDLAGRLLTTTSAGVDTVDTYYNTNQLASVTNGANVSTYQYDVAGNRTNETFANAAGTYENATTTWDALNRMVTYSDTGGTEGAPAAISWQYDLNGNIRRMTASAPSLDAYGAITPGGAYQDYWYKYDSMNRFVMTQAAFDPGTGTIYLTENGPSESFTYDAAGERVRMGYTTSHQIDDNDAHETETVVKETDEVYTYTADGYLAEVGTAIGAITDYYASDPLYMHLPAAPTGPGATSVVYTYDAMGRVTDYVENDASGVYAYERSATYDNKSEVTHDVVTSVRSDGTYVSTTSYDYGAAVTSGGVTTYTGAYQGGDVTHSHTTTMKGSSAQPTTDTVNTYVWWDSAQQAVTTFNPDTSHSTLNTSTYSYDSLGHISSVAIADGRPRTVTFVTDNDGEVLRRDEADSLSSGDPHE